MKKTGSEQAMPAEPFERARLQADVAKQRVRIAKEELKRARKRLKEAKRESKRARKQSTAARKAFKRARRNRRSMPFRRPRNLNRRQKKINSPTLNHPRRQLERRQRTRTGNIPPDSHSARGPEDSSCSSGSAKAEHHLICLAANCRVEHQALMIIAGIAQNVALRFKHETRRFDLPAHLHRIDPMQCFGVSQAGSRCGHMIDYQQHASGFQGIKKCFIERCNIRRSQEGVMQVMVILRRPNKIELFRHAILIERAAQQSNVCKTGIVSDCLSTCNFTWRTIGDLFLGDERVDAASRPDHIAQDSGEIPIPGHEVRDVITSFHA